MIAKVDPDSEAAARGISEGERIASINNEEVTDVNEAQDLLAEVQKSDRNHALLQIEGQRGSRFVALPIPQG